MRITVGFAKGANWCCADSDDSLEPRGSKPTAAALAAAAPKEDVPDRPNLLWAWSSKSRRLSWGMPGLLVAAERRTEAEADEVLVKIFERLVSSADASVATDATEGCAAWGSGVSATCRLIMSPMRLTSCCVFCTLRRMLSRSSGVKAPKGLLRLANSLAESLLAEGLSKPATEGVRI